MLVNQVGCYGINVGRIDFYFENGETTANGFHHHRITIFFTSLWFHWMIVLHTD